MLAFLPEASSSADLTIIEIHLFIYVSMINQDLYSAREPASCMKGVMTTVLLQLSFTYTGPFSDHWV